MGPIYFVVNWSDWLQDTRPPQRGLASAIICFEETTWFTWLTSRALGPDLDWIVTVHGHSHCMLGFSICIFHHWFVWCLKNETNFFLKGIWGWTGVHQVQRDNESMKFDENVELRDFENVMVHLRTFSLVWCWDLNGSISLLVLSLSVLGSISGALWGVGTRFQCRGPSTS